MYKRGRTHLAGKQPAYYVKNDLEETALNNSESKVFDISLHHGSAVRKAAASGFHEPRLEDCHCRRKSFFTYQSVGPSTG